MRPVQNLHEWYVRQVGDSLELHGIVKSGWRIAAHVQCYRDRVAVADEAPYRLCAMHSDIGANPARRAHAFDLLRAIS